MSIQNRPRFPRRYVDIFLSFSLSLPSLPALVLALTDSFGQFYRGSQLQFFLDIYPGGHRQGKGLWDVGKGYAAPKNIRSTYVFGLVVLGIVCLLLCWLYCRVLPVAPFFFVLDVAIHNLPSLHIVGRQIDCTRFYSNDAVRRVCSFRV